MTTAMAPRADTAALAPKVKTVRDYLVSQQGQLEAALPSFMNPTRFLRAAFTEFSKTPSLYDCSTRSLLGALIQCAQLGLEPGVLGYVYLVPFKNRRRGTTEVTVIPGYKGLLALARRSGEISTISAHPVYQGDAFRYAYGLDQVLEHVPSQEPHATVKDGVRVERPLTHVYAACKLKDGGSQFEVMTLAEVEAHRDRYVRVQPDSAWTTNFVEMALKTVLRRLCRLLPASTELTRAITLDAQVRHGEPQNLATLVAGAESMGEEAAGEAPPEAAEEAPASAEVGEGPTGQADPRPVTIAAIRIARDRIRPNLTDREWDALTTELLGTQIVETADAAALDDLCGFLTALAVKDKAATERFKKIVAGK